MEKLNFVFDDLYKGFGHSEGLPRGLQLFYKGENRTQEGMGLCTVAIKDNGDTFFSGKHLEHSEEGMRISLKYCLDTSLLTGPSWFVSDFLTRLRDKGIEFYKRHPGTQTLQLSMDRFLRRFFRIRRVFRQGKKKGEALIQYAIDEDEIRVSAKILILEGNRPKICIMNELGADWFDKGFRDGQIIEPPSAWQELPSNGSLPSLYSSKLGICFSISDIALSEDLPFQLFWGREKTRELCWSGFTIEAKLNRPNISEVTCSYKITFSKPGDREGA